MENNTPKEKKEECHCSRTSRFHTQDSNYSNHSVERCWSIPHQPDSMEMLKKILIELTDKFGYDHTPRQLEAFQKAESEIKDLLALSRAEGEKSGIMMAKEALDEIAFEQDNGHKVELFLNWDEGEKKLKDLLNK